MGINQSKKDYTVGPLPDHKEFSFERSFDFENDHTL